MIGSTSFSRLKVYETCPYHAKLAFVDKIPQPVDTSRESPLDRGSRVHDLAEKYIRGTAELVHELKNFEKELTTLKQHFTERPKHVLLEQMWCFDNAWNTVPDDDFVNTWLRVKLDACWFVDDSQRIAVVVDYKTGKKYGNEVKHMEQMQLYQLATFLRFPQVEEVEVELWYFDQNETTPAHFKRKNGLRFLKLFNDRMMAMTTATDFPPRPSLYTCRFCPYKTGALGKNGLKGTGHCDKNPE